MQTVKLLGEVLDGVEEFIDVLIEGNYHVDLYRLTEKFPALELASCAEVEQAQDRGDVEHIDHRSEYTEDKHLIHLCLAELSVFLLEFFLFVLLAVEDLNDFHSRKVFGEEDIDVGRAVLYLTVSAAREFTEDHGEEHDEGHEAENYERQHIVEQEHRTENTEDDEDVFDKVY